MTRVAQSISARQNCEENMKSITVYADYVCPFCLLAESVIEDVIGDRDIQIHWAPFELRPFPIPTLKPEDTYLPTIWERSVYPQARALGVPIKLPTISPQPRTAKAFELLMLAKKRGVEHAYSMRVLQAFFQEDRDIGDPSILVSLAADAGLDPEEARRALAEGIYTDAYEASLSEAVQDLKIDVVPTIVVGGQIFRGTPSREALSKAIEALTDGSVPTQD